MEMHHKVLIPVDQTALEGELIIPEKAKAIVLFAHGSGSSRFSPRNQFVAKFLRSRRLATLLIDLLSEEEEAIDDTSPQLRFDIELLSRRLCTITDWLLRDDRTKNLLIGYFGASTGAAATLIAAAKKPSHVYAVVSRGGRPDLAGNFLEKVLPPTLLIIGGNDTVVIGLNKEAAAKLRCETKIAIVPGATHLFEEPGTLEKVANQACEWFLNKLPSKQNFI
jgi:pimeloyl-ACP methyl ester carboxylesterase